MSTSIETIRRVQVLDPHVAERIAAGEVIERPSSVVKELVENSLDAGATEIAVALEDGGKSLIEVLDNGHGMLPEDLSLCIQRHATSKLRSLDDLEKILTLGFRGEALPSIAAVSDVSLLSRAREAQTAYQMNLTSMVAAPKPEAVTFGHFLTAPHGTRIQARGLFSQVPARLKFLKSQNAEVAQVREWIERLALAHPGTGFRLLSDGRTLLNLRPQSEVERVRAILGDGDDFPILTADSTDNPDLKVRVHWIQGLSTPQTRRLVQVVNGRSIRDRMLQQAMLAPFRQALLPWQFPAVALFVEVNPALIDVNVHPTKTEIRFLNSREVFHAVDKLLESLIEKRGAPGFVPTRGLESSGANPGAVELPARTAFQFQTPSTPTPSWQASEAVPRHQPALEFRSGFSPSMEVPPRGESSWSTPASTQPESPQLESTSAEPRGPARHGLDLDPSRFMGIAFNTYLFYDLGDQLVLIDQHAAHERVRYEKLKARVFSPERKANSQALLIPEAVKFDAIERAALESRLEWMEQIGFEVEIFGEDTVLFRAVPGEWGTRDLRTRLKNLIERVLVYEPKPSEGDAPATGSFMDETLFEKIASEACHSAVRAGDRLEDEEALALISQLFDCDHPWNCPHGRPTVVKVPKGKVEEWFQRRV